MKNMESKSKNQSQNKTSSSSSGIFAFTADRRRDSSINGINTTASQSFFLPFRSVEKFSGKKSLIGLSGCNISSCKKSFKFL